MVRVLPASEVGHVPLRRPRLRLKARLRSCLLSRVTGSLSESVLLMGGPSVTSPDRKLESSSEAASETCRSCLRFCCPREVWQRALQRVNRCGFYLVLLSLCRLDAPVENQAVSDDLITTPPHPQKHRRGEPAASGKRACEPDATCSFVVRRPQEQEPPSQMAFVCWSCLEFVT